MEHIGGSTLKEYSDAHTHTPSPALAHPGQTVSFWLGKKVKIFRFAIKVVELIGVKHMTISAYKSKCSSQRSSTAHSVRRARNASL